MPFMGGGDIAEHGNTKRLKGAQTISFCTMFNVQRVLGDKLQGVIDAMAPGGTGNPFENLTTHQREELAALYRLGFPRGDEFIIGEPMGQMWQWAAEADSIYEQDPSYFENFWTVPGYVGHDLPQVVTPDRIDRRVTISRVLNAQDVMDDPSLATPEFGTFRSVLQGVVEGTGTGYELPCVLEIKDLGPGYRLGAGIRILNGTGAGRQLYAVAVAGDYIFCDARGETSNLRLTDVLPGDEAHVDNSRWLAYGYYARHHLMDDPQFDFLRVDRKPIYAQHSLADLSSMMGVCYSGLFTGKLLWVHHTHDASLWPPQGVLYANAVAAAQGDEGARERYRLRWTDHAEHIPASFLPNPPGRASNTWLIDYLPVIEQSLQDLVDWVEQSIEPTAPITPTQMEGDTAGRGVGPGWNSAGRHRDRERDEGPKHEWASRSRWRLQPAFHPWPARLWPSSGMLTVQERSHSRAKRSTAPPAPSRYPSRTPMTGQAHTLQRPE